MAKVIVYRDRYPFGTEAYNNADEHWHQVCFCEFVRKEYRDYYRYLFAIPNGGHRNPVEAANLKMEGVKPGVTDMEFAKPFFVNSAAFGSVIFCGLFIEMKKPVKSYGVSDKQVAFMADMRSQGYATAVCSGWHQAVGAFLYYIGSIDAQTATERYSVDVSADAWGTGIMLQG